MRENIYYDREMIDQLKEELMDELSRPAHTAGTTGHARQKALREKLLGELRELSARENYFNQSDPQMAELLQELLAQANNRGTGIRNSSAKVPLRQRLNRFVRSGEGRGFSWGVGVTILALLLLPNAKRYLKPAARKVMAEVLDISDRVQCFLSQTKEDLEDLLAEARFDKINSALNDDAENVAQEPTGEEG